MTATAYERLEWAEVEVKIALRHLRMADMKEIPEEYTRMRGTNLQANMADKLESMADDFEVLKAIVRGDMS